MSKKSIVFWFIAYVLVAWGLPVINIDQYSDSVSSAHLFIICGGVIIFCAFKLIDCCEKRGK